MFPSKPDSTRHVLVGRGSRSLVVLLAVAWLSLVWRFDPNSLTRIDPAVGAIAHGLLKSVIILLGADIIWHLARSWIDRTLAAS
ncbi:mechanosensitive ion channel family protein, partial [Rhizobium ruizarguesonis]